MEYTNRIQFYRKALGLSQEELGEKMFVSRQTVSQWETGQTTPSSESLIKLREIFGVSIDSILGVEYAHESSKTVTEAPASADRETYICSYSKDEMKEIVKSIPAPKFERIAVFLFFLSAFSLLGMISDSSVTFKTIAGVFFGFFVGYLIIYIKTIIYSINTNKKSIERCPQVTYEYTFENGILIAKSMKKGEVFLEVRCPVYELENLTDIGDYYTFVIKRFTYIIRKANLGGDSKLLLHLKNNKNLTTLPSKSEKRLKVISNITFAASILSIYSGIATATLFTIILGDVNNPYNFVKNIWALFLFLPIPIFSIILGFILKKRGMKYKKNIVVGIVMCLVLCLFGSFTFIFSDMQNAIVTVREEMNIALPEDIGYSMSTITPKNSDTMKSATMGHITFSTEDSKNFYSSLDENWLTEFSDELEEYIAIDTDDYAVDFCLLYNADTSEYNTVPKKHGDYDMILMLFSKSKNELYIIEYRLFP